MIVFYTWGLTHPGHSLFRIFSRGVFSRGQQRVHLVGQVRRLSIDRLAVLVDVVEPANPGVACADARQVNAGVVRAHHRQRVPSDVTCESLDVGLEVLPRDRAPLGHVLWYGGWRLTRFRSADSLAMDDVEDGAGALDQLLRAIKPESTLEIYISELVLVPGVRSCIRH
jgi:hypothetical protein